jgi:hypothetical protein
MNRRHAAPYAASGFSHLSPGNFAKSRRGGRALLTRDDHQQRLARSADLDLL